MKALLTISEILFAFTASAQELRFKSYEDSTGNYTVRYEITPDDTAFVTGEVPHFNAIITVLPIIGIDTTAVYQALLGIYAEWDFLCDEPQKIVDRHRKLNTAEQ